MTYSTDIKIAFNKCIHSTNKSSIRKYNFHILYFKIFEQIEMI